jgi:hypothetical protein
MIVETSGRHLGTFNLHGQKVFGQLYLAAGQSYLMLRTEDKPAQLSVPDVVHGRLHDFTFVSCIDCVGGSIPPTRIDFQEHHSYSWNLFPHFALMGNRYFNPIKDKITDVWFSVSDAALIFNDVNSYGILDEVSASIADLIQKSVGDHQVPHGPQPRLAYFAGQCDLLKVVVSEGTIIVQHWPTHERSESEGIHLKSFLKLGIRFSASTELSSCLRAISMLTQFLSLVAGRSQGVSNVLVQTDGASEKDMPFLLHWSFSPLAESTNEEQDKPSFIDMPLDAIRRPDEFTRVLTTWWETSPSQGLARARLHSCRSRGNLFDIDRLVAAANMFDLRATGVLTEISEELDLIRKESVEALKKLPITDDRDGVIMALQRVGAPSLRKKILLRAAVVKSRFKLENLDDVLRLAVLSRNFFVHGGGDRSFDYATVKPYTAFLTETLEFVFAAAELIDCGWDGTAWKNQPHTSRHWFSRYLSDYSNVTRDMLLACGNTAEMSHKLT